ncbi:MAG: hypothetical protein IPL24_15040 [Bacteroidetes bacterium]|nr:hypothetical protein [Bacteroidota bacterium]
MKKDSLLIIALYLLACMAVMPFVKWYVDNPDSLQYINVVQHILDGRFSLAVNGYWSPLISWFLLPFMIFLTMELSHSNFYRWPSVFLLSENG